MNNKKRNVALYILVFVVIISVGGIIGYNIYGRGSHISDYSSLPRYGDIQSMYDESDIIVIGEVNKVNELFIVDRRDYYILGPTDKKEDFMPWNSSYVVSEVKIYKVLKGNIEQDELIEVIQETFYDNNIYSSADDRLKRVKVFKVKEKYVLFLTYFSLDSEQAKKDFKTPKYLPIRMHQGQLAIVDNKVKINKERLSFYGNNMTVEDIEKVISEYKIK